MRAVSALYSFGDQVDDVDHVLLATFVFLCSPARGRNRRGFRPHHRIGTAVVRLADAAISHRGDDDVTPLFGELHQVVTGAIGTIHGVSRAKRDEHRELRGGRPPRRNEQAIRNRLAGAGEIVDSVLLALVLIERTVGSWFGRRRGLWRRRLRRRGRRGLRASYDGGVRAEQDRRRDHTKRQRCSHGSPRCWG